jgi:hypothetical protein
MIAEQEVFEKEISDVEIFTKEVSDMTAKDPEFRMIVEQEVFVNELFDRIVKDFDFSKPGIFDISSSGIEIESFDFEKGQKTFSPLKYLIVKEIVDFYYQVGDLKATAGHMLFDESSKKFIRADSHPSAKRVDEKMFVVDFTVEDTHNYYANGFLNHNTSPGGRALKHACSVMVNMAKINSADSNIEDENEVVIGHKVKAKIQKNKVGAPFREAIYAIKYVEGLVGQEEELLDVAVICGIITRPNNKTYEFGDKKFVGRQTMLDYLKDQNIFAEVENLCREKYISGESFSASAIEDSDENEEDEGSIFDTIEES